MEKYLYCIRHGYALHNQLYKEIGEKAYTLYRDTPLLEKGFEQAKSLNKSFQDLNKIELVLVSPCTRTLDTTVFVFNNRNIPIISKDFLIEYPIGGDENCNKRKDVSDLKCLYPYINFEIENNKVKWDENYETLENLEKRIEKLLYYIGSRKEKHIAIVGHSSYLGQMKDSVVGDESNELKHCYPYKIIANYNKDGNFVSLRKND